ncbi:uncharacterized protein LOC108099829 [Drosophila ficusphila]|uniref:uncharacterized protein LOC108099829 n=1 Tax=Drosophila ficusphila TaxID=30025 RepID=UPI0007E766B3|nr:uncharacterized protein LOC108099829 [Drosophila ficusphila]
MEKWLADSFKKLLEDDALTDCTVIVENKKFRCHKVVLGISSECFRRAFQTGFIEAETGELTLTDVSAEIFETFRLYLYTYDQDIIRGSSNSDIIKLMNCADMWMVQPLSKVCVEIVRARLQNMKFVDLLLYFEHVQGEQFSELQICISHWLKTIIECEEIPQEAYELGSEAFRRFLKLIKGSISERKLYDMVERYVGIKGIFVHQSEYKNWKFNELKDPSKNDLPASETENTNQNYVKELLSMIDYKEMTIDEFFEGPGRSKYITFRDKYFFMHQIAKTTENNKPRSPLSVSMTGAQRGRHFLPLEIGAQRRAIFTPGNRR